jgi:hypothetical protein
MNVSSRRDGVTVRAQRSDRLAQRASFSALPLRRAAPNPAPRGRQARCARCPTRSLPRQASVSIDMDAAQTLLDGAGRELLARESANLDLLVVGAGTRLGAAPPGFQL